MDRLAQSKTAHAMYMTVTRADGSVFDLGLADFDHPDRDLRIAGKLEVVRNRIKTQTIRLSAGGKAPSLLARLRDYRDILTYYLSIWRD